MKFKIKTKLVSGILFAVISGLFLIVMPNQVKLPGFDSGAPSPRIIPGACLWITLFFSIVLIIQSLVFKKEKVVEFDMKNEGPALLLILALCIYVFLIIKIGYIFASIIVFCFVLWYAGERKPPIYIFTILAAIGIFYLFKRVFYISLPDSFAIIRKLIGG